MKNKSTSNSEIINASKEIFKEKGLNSLNMREVASRCNVALGSIYNYYPSKSMLLLDTIDSIWKEILHKFNFEGNRFDEKVRDLFYLIQKLIYIIEEYIAAQCNREINQTTNLPPVTLFQKEIR